MKSCQIAASMSCVLWCLLGTLHAQNRAFDGESDTSSHTVKMVAVQDGVKLEVLDWGGSGQTLVLLAGKGFTAHTFDQFAPMLTARYHVFGITRRGYGASSVPPTTDANYSAERLGDDVIAVLDALRLSRPVVAGHSIAGEELSSIGTRAPGRVAGLVYLDAAYAYAFYDARTGDLTIDYNTLRSQLERFTALNPMKERKQLVADIPAMLPRFEQELALYRKRFAAAPDNAPAPPDTVANRVDVAIFRGEQKFGAMTCPILAIYADPHSFGEDLKRQPEALKAAQDKDQADTSAQADAFSKGNPQATVIRIPNADHFVFRSNAPEVIQALDRFVATLSR